MSAAQSHQLIHWGSDRLAGFPMLAERISIRDLPAVLKAVAEVSGTNCNPQCKLKTVGTV